MTGGILNSGDEVTRRLQEHLERHAWVGWGKVRVIAGALGDHAAVIGVADLACTRSEHQ